MKSWQEDVVIYPKFTAYCDRQGYKLGDTINHLIKEYLEKHGVIELEPIES